MPLRCSNCVEHSNGMRFVYVFSAKFLPSDSVVVDDSEVFRQCGYKVVYCVCPLKIGGWGENLSIPAHVE